MGQKVNPTGIRLGNATDWRSKWYAEGKEYSSFLHKDLEVRAFLEKKLASASVSRIQIERPAKSAFITIHTARPGVVIGQNGADIEKPRQQTASLMDIHPNNVKLNNEEIRKPELDAK